MGEPDVVLTQRDERDIKKYIESIRKQLLGGNTTIIDDDRFISINCNSDGPLSPEAVESVIQALSSGYRHAKIANKKYTPKKYRK